METGKISRAADRSALSLDELSQTTILLEERNSRSTLSSRVCLNASCYRSTFWLPWPRIPGITAYLPSEAKPKPDNHDYKATNSFWINYWPLSAVGRGTTWDPVSQRYCQLLWRPCLQHGSPPDTATTGSRDPSSHWTDTEMMGKLYVSDEKK